MELAVMSYALYLLGTTLWFPGMIVLGGILSSKLYKFLRKG